MSLTKIPRQLDTDILTDGTYMESKVITYSWTTQQGVPHVSGCILHLPLLPPFRIFFVFLAPSPSPFPPFVLFFLLFSWEPAVWTLTFFMVRCFCFAASALQCFILQYKTKIARRVQRLQKGGYIRHVVDSADMFVTLPDGWTAPHTPNRVSWKQIQTHAFHGGGYVEFPYISINLMWFPPTVSLAVFYKAFPH